MLYTLNMCILTKPTINVVPCGSKPNNIADDFGGFIVVNKFLSVTMESDSLAMSYATAAAVRSAKAS